MNILCIDIGGTFIKYAHMNENCEFLLKGRIETPSSGRDALIASITSLFRSFPGCEGIAISMAGIIDSDNGYCRMGGAIRYNDNFFIRDALFKECPVPIVIDNDAKCAAMAEAAIGSLKDVNDGVLITIGTMVGGGIIHDKKLIRGKHFSAGEVSYLIPNTEKAATPDNVWGNFCGTPRLCKLYAEKCGIDTTSETITGFDVFEALSDGVIEAEEALNEYTRHIAVQLFNIQNFFDPELISISGGISERPELIYYIRKNLEKLYDECPYQIPHVQVVSSTFKNDANLIGALQVYLEKYR